MGFDFNFRLAEDMSDIWKLEKHLLQQSLSYPSYADWVVGKVSPEIESGYKKAILALSDSYLVGNLITQPHKNLDGVLEFKNMRVHPKLQGRYVGAFMLRQGERIAYEENYSAIICDTHADNLNVISLLNSQGYEEIARIPLYDKNTEEIIFGKRFEKTQTGFFLPIKKKIIASAA